MNAGAGVVAKESCRECDAKPKRRPEGHMRVRLALVLVAILAAAFLFIRRWQSKLSFENTAGVNLHFEQKS